MPGYWERVIASYTDGKMRFGNRQRYFPDPGLGSDSIYDSSQTIGGSEAATNFDLSLYGVDDIVYLTPFLVPIKSIFSSIGVMVNSPTGPAGRVKFAIYEDVSFEQQAGTPASFKVLEGTENLVAVSTNSSGFRSVFFTPNLLELRQGLVWLAIRFNQSCGIGAIDMTGIPPYGGFDFNTYTSYSAGRHLFIGLTGSGVPFNPPFPTYLDVYMVPPQSTPPLIPRIGLTLFGALP
jgi:hypothetical protein